MHLTVSPIRQIEQRPPQPPTQPRIAAHHLEVMNIQVLGQAIEWDAYGLSDARCRQGGDFALDTRLVAGGSRRRWRRMR